MSDTTKRAQKVTRYALSGILVAGMVFFTGFLSFTGALLINASVGLAIGAFFLSGGIEGEVYAQNITNSLSKILNGNYWEEVVLETILKKLIEKNKDHESRFLKDYKALEDYLEELEAAHDHSKAKELKEARRSLKWKKAYFADFMLREVDYKNNSDRYPFHAELHEALKGLPKEAITPSAIRKKIRRKVLLSRLGWILNLSAGISCGLAAVSVAQASLSALAVYFGLTISAAALSGGIFAIAFVAAIGYTLLIHNTITNMIKNETLRKWASKTREFFRRRVNSKTKLPESRGHYIVRLIFGSIGVSLVVGLATFATVATAGTWWHAAKAGAKMLPYLRRAAAVLRGIFVTLMGITTLLFNIVNSLKSVKELVKISFKKHWHNFTHRLNSFFNRENLTQFLNPFRFVIAIITIPFRFIAFMLHLISMGFMGDNLDKVPPLASAALATTNEAIQDGHYFLPEDHHDHEKMHSLHLFWEEPKEAKLKKTLIITQKNPQLIRYDEEGNRMVVFTEEELPEVLKTLNLGALLHHPLIENEKETLSRSILHELSKEQIHKLNQLTNQKVDHAHGHSHHHHHDHSHADLAGKLLFVVLSPLYFLAALWDYAWSRFNRSKDSSKPQLSFKEALHKSFFDNRHHEREVFKPVISNAWKHYEVCARTDKAKDEALQSSKLSLPEKDAIRDLAGLLNKAKTTSPESCYFVEGKFNAPTFFKNNASLGKKAKASCEKMIRISEESRQSVPTAA